jgi:hypothetical protein
MAEVHEAGLAMRTSALRHCCSKKLSSRNRKNSSSAKEPLVTFSQFKFELPF